MSELDQIAAGATKLLNTHGYAFEQAVIQYCDRTFKSKQSSWRFVVSELPVLLHDRPHHIDCVLQHEDTRAVMLGECKRVDPARGRWCFFRRTYTRSDDVGIAARPILSVVSWAGGIADVVESPVKISDATPFHLGLALKVDTPSADGVYTDKDDALSKAIDQAFRSTSGYIDFLKGENRTSLLAGQRRITLVPVVFTTAQLVTASTSISYANVLTGNLSSLELAPAKWIWYQANLSKHLRPTSSHPLESRYDYRHLTLEQIVLLRHTRAACVVNVTYLSEFLRSMSDPLSIDPV